MLVQQDYMAQSLQFELSVCILLMHICQEQGFCDVKFDKNRILGTERVDTDLIRITDNKKSRPDAIIYSGNKVIPVDVKNHSKSKVSKKEIIKLHGDSEVRSAFPGILVLQEDGYLTDDAYEECQERSIMVVKLARRRKGDQVLERISHVDVTKYNKDYLTEENVRRLTNAIMQQLVDFEVDRGSRTGYSAISYEEKEEVCSSRYSKYGGECEVVKSTHVKQVRVVSYEHKERKRKRSTGEKKDRKGKKEFKEKLDRTKAKRNWLFSLLG